MEHPTTFIEEFVTIIAASTHEAMQQFKAQGLDLLGFHIVGRVGPNRFSVVRDQQSSDLFAGQPMIAATFSRHVSA